MEKITVLLVEDAAETDPQQWSQRAAAACLAPGESWETTLSTTFER